VTTARTLADPDVYDVALLAGGAPRVVEAAVVALVTSGRVRVRSPGELAVVSLVRRHPVEAAVLDAIGPAGHRSVETVRWRAADDARLLDVDRRLRDGGLVRSGVRPPWRSAARQVPTRAGRRVLRERRAQVGSTAGDVLRVALDGPAGLTDTALRAELFAEPGASGAAHGRRLGRRMTELARLRQSDYDGAFRAPLHGPEDGRGRRA
jgi:hypothetical protein